MELVTPGRGSPVRRCRWRASDHLSDAPAELVGYAYLDSSALFHPLIMLRDVGGTLERGRNRDAVEPFPGFLPYADRSQHTNPRGNALSTQDINGSASEYEEPAEAAIEPTDPTVGQSVAPPELETAPPSEVEAPEVIDVEPVADPVEPEPAGPLLEVIETLGRIEGKVAESQRLLDRQSEVSSRLHAENQVLRAGELRKAQLPLVLNILRVYDDVTRMAETAADSSSGGDLQLAAEAMTDALERSGVERLMIAPGEPFDAKRHKVTAIDPATDPEAERTVSRVVRTGFAWSDGELVRVSEVAVFKYTPPAQQADEPSRASDGSEAVDVPLEPADSPPVSRQADSLPNSER